jgi:NAD(P) transhydrogenase
MEFDLLVIGSGPAGEKGAAQAAYFGKSVALVEKDSGFGGAAANLGTLPSKTLRETALYLSGFRKRDLYGVGFDSRQRIDSRRFLSHFLNVRDRERNRIASNLDRHGIESFRGAASFIDANTVRVGTDRILSAGKILIATGSSPVHPPEYPWEDDRIRDSNTILAMEHLPEALLVVGGGVIGVEYACIFAALGVRVTLVDGRDALLGFLDGEVSRALQTAMVRMGVDLRLSTRVESVHAGAQVTVCLSGAGGMDFDAVLVASGRRGCTEQLGLEQAGLSTNARGLLNVNGHYQTAQPHIYAAGDVIGFPALASTSMEQARLAMCHAFDLRYKSQLAQVLPLGIYSIPEVSCAGESEESLRKSGVPFVVGRARYSENSRGFILGDEDGFLKLIFRAADLRLLGVHCLGESATDLVHTGLAAILLEQSADFFIGTCFNYPTLSEMYKYAAYDALGRLQRGEVEGRAEG